MDDTQKQFEERIEMCTRWLRELADTEGLVVEYKRRPDKWNIDHNWRVMLGEPPETLGTICLRSLEIALPDGEKGRMLEERFDLLLKARWGVK